ncbi:PH domain-containing protein [Nocardia sp. NPDC052254]|uniref:PH domain-containing protein n=1 Tax=Nocardia sp. NPDC052254 TaxID=3155681 RepID=UPI00342F1AFC
MIRIPRLGHLAVFILLICAAFPFFGWPAVLWILFLIPIAAAWWVERTQTTVSAAGLDTRTVFGSGHIDWAQIKGLRIPKRGFVRVHLTDDSEKALPAVSYDRLKDLIAASGGRIPDPFAQPAASATAPARADEATSDSAAPGDATAGDTTSDDTAATDPAPGGVTSDDAAPDDTTPGNTARD